MEIIDFIKKHYVLNEYRLFITLIYILSFYGIYKLVAGDVSLWWLAIAIVWHKFIQLFGNTIGMHRYFSHKSFNTTPAWEKFLAWISMFLGVGSPMQYARNHRHHHRVSDQPNDWHSPTNDGKLMTMLGVWEFHSLSWFMERGGYTPRDLMKHPTYRFIHNHYYKMWYPMLIITWLVNPLITLYVLVIPSFLVHLDFNILTNCIAHSWGYRNFDTSDTSRNNRWLNYIQAGEGWHNNHHAHPHLYDFAVKRNEFDFSAWVIEKFIAIDGPKTREGKLRID